MNKIKLHLDKTISSFYSVQTKKKQSQNVGGCKCKTPCGDSLLCEQDGLKCLNQERQKK